MGKMKDIQIQTMNDVNGLNEQELKEVINEKCEKLGTDASIYYDENSTKDKLIDVIGNLNIRIAAKKIMGVL